MLEKNAKIEKIKFSRSLIKIDFSEKFWKKSKKSKIENFEKFLKNFEKFLKKFEKIEKIEKKFQNFFEKKSILKIFSIFERMWSSRVSEWIFDFFYRKFAKFEKFFAEKIQNFTHFFPCFWKKLKNFQKNFPKQIGSLGPKLCEKAKKRNKKPKNIKERPQNRFLKLAISRNCFRARASSRPNQPI